jgi:HAD superfamily hydrolase (TIGR01549 family)
MIKAILFDFGQTLVDSAGGFRAAEKEAQMRIFADLGVESWTDFLARYRKLRGEFHARSDFSRRALWEAVYSHFGCEPAALSLRDAEREYWETVQSHTQPFAEAGAVVAQLAGRYPLALITNTQGQGTGYRHRLALFPNLERHFRVIIIAGEDGVPPKPDPAPFKYCLEFLDVTPDQAVYVGDDWRIDICGAQAAGIRPIWLQHCSVSRNWPTAETTVPVITSLEQLPEILLTIGETRARNVGPQL